MPRSCNASDDLGYSKMTYLSKISKSASKNPENSDLLYDTVKHVMWDHSASCDMNIVFTGHIASTVLQRKSSPPFLFTSLEQLILVIHSNARHLLSIYQAQKIKSLVSAPLSVPDGWANFACKFLSTAYRYITPLTAADTKLWAFRSMGSCCW